MKEYEFISFNNKQGEDKYVVEFKCNGLCVWKED